MKIHHIGYLVKSIEEAAESFRGLGFSDEGGTVYDTVRDIDILFMTNGTYRIELVCPKSDKSVVSNTLKKIGNSPYHICYICGDIETAQNEMRESGFIPTGEAQPALAIGGRRVCFMYSGEIGLVELVEK